MIVDLLRNDLGRIARPGIGALERRVRAGAVRDRVAAHVHGARRARRRGRALARRLPRALPQRIGHRRAEGPDDGDHRRAGGLASRRLLRRRRLPRADRVDAPAARVQRGDPHGACSTPRPARAEYGVGGGITWDSSAGGEYDETVAKARVLTARRPPFELFETMRHDPGEAFRHLDAAPRAAPGARAAYFGFAFDEQAVARALDEGRVGSGDRPRPGPRLAVDRPGRRSTSARPRSSRRPSPCRLAIDRRIPWTPPTPCCSTRRRCAALRGRACPPSRRR